MTFMRDLDLEVRTWVLNRHAFFILWTFVTRYFEIQSRMAKSHLRDKSILDMTFMCAIDLRGSDLSLNREHCFALMNIYYNYFEIPCWMVKLQTHRLSCMNIYAKLFKNNDIRRIEVTARTQNKLRPSCVTLTLREGTRLANATHGFYMMTIYAK